MSPNIVLSRLGSSKAAPVWSAMKSSIEVIELLDSSEVVCRLTGDLWLSVFGIVFDVLKGVRLGLCNLRLHRYAGERESTGREGEKRGMGIKSRSGLLVGRRENHMEICA
jgi:hypothetical protein